ncbi:hypothetical protein [Tardiphaga alba]|nr:hypothetical protein [Tardiphaga alba]
MTPAAALDMHRRFIQEVGEDILIRRYTGTGSPRPKTDTATRARVMGYEPKELVGSIVQGDRKIIALVDDLAGILPITTNDKAVVRGKELAIKAVDDSTRRIAGTLIALEIQAGG